MKKKIVFFISFLVVCLFQVPRSSAQINWIIIDTSLSNNFIVDLNDTILSSYGPFGCGSHLYELDLDGNDSVDLTFHAVCYIGGMGNSFTIELFSSDDSWFSMDTAVIDLAGSFDSTGTAVYVPATFSMVEIYNYHDTVYSVNCNQQTVTKISNRNVSTYPSLCEHASLDNWISGQHFIGIKKQINGAIYTGWVRVEVLDYQKILIKEFALNIDLSALKTEADDEFIIFPNPIGDRLFLKGKDLKNATVKVFDINGIFRSEHFFYEGNQGIPLQSLSPGIYLMQIERNGVRFHRKFVKN